MSDLEGFEIDVDEDDVLEQVVSFPDRTDMPDLPKDPFAIKSRTDDGDVVRPAVVTVLLNREMARAVNRRLRRQAKRQGVPEPIIVRQKPLNDRETTDKMTDIILTEWEQYHGHFPLATLQEFLDDRTAKVMEEAYRTGRPIDRDAVRQAVGRIWDQAKQKQGQA